MNEPEIKFYESDIEKVFQKLVSNWTELTNFYHEEVKFEYDDPNERLPYVDIGDISRFIVEKKKSGQTEQFELFFEQVEELLIHGEPYVQELIVIGLFEGI